MASVVELQYPVIYQAYVTKHRINFAAQLDWIYIHVNTVAFYQL